MADKTDPGNWVQFYFKGGDHVSVECTKDEFTAITGVLIDSMTSKPREVFTQTVKVKTKSKKFRKAVLKTLREEVHNGAFKRDALITAVRGGPKFGPDPDSEPSMTSSSGWCDTSDKLVCKCRHQARDHGYGAHHGRFCARIGCGCQSFQEQTPSAETEPESSPWPVCHLPVGEQGPEIVTIPKRFEVEPGPILSALAEQINTGTLTVGVGDEPADPPKPFSTILKDVFDSMTENLLERCDSCNHFRSVHHPECSSFGCSCRGFETKS